MIESLEKWLAEDIGCSLDGARRYLDKHPHVLKCWQAATLAERERCESIVLAECTPGCNCPECGELKAIAAAIRKGEGV